MVAWLLRCPDCVASHLLVHDIRYLLLGYAAFDIRHIYHEANNAANWFASFVAQHSGGFFWIFMFCWCPLGISFFGSFGLYSYSLCMKHPFYQKENKKENINGERRWEEIGWLVTSQVVDPTHVTIHWLTLLGQSDETRFERWLKVISLLWGSDRTRFERWWKVLILLCETRCWKIVLHAIMRMDSCIFLEKYCIKINWPIIWASHCCIIWKLCQ